MPADKPVQPSRKVTVRLNDDQWLALREHCLRQRTTIQKVVVSALARDIKDFKSED